MIYVNVKNYNHRNMLFYIGKTMFIEVMNAYDEVDIIQAGVLINSLVRIRGLILRGETISPLITRWTALLESKSELIFS